MAFGAANRVPVLERRDQHFKARRLAKIKRRAEAWRRRSAYLRMRRDATWEFMDAPRVMDDMP